MTQRQRDARWWRNLARDYEQRTERVVEAYGVCSGICYHVNLWTLQHVEAVGAIGSFWWPEVSRTSPDAYDLRATACCLIAAMVEAGDA